MCQKTYSTKDIAEYTGVHPNTVRLYELWGFIAKADRAKNNYRIFYAKHLRQMQLARLALPGPYPVDYGIVHGLVKAFAAGDLKKGISYARDYLVKAEAELHKGIIAMGVLDRWYANNPGSRETVVFSTRKQMGAALGLTIDALRTWERNGLYHTAKDERGRLQFTEWDVEKMTVIKLLRNCGYSIASLLNVFGNESSHVAKPSELLALHSNQSEITYVTDRYIEYLEGHISRAQKIITFLEEEPRKN